MSKLATVCDIIGTEQNADIPIKLGLLAYSGPARPTRFAMLGQVPAKLLRQLDSHFKCDTYLKCESLYRRSVSEAFSGR